MQQVIAGTACVVSFDLLVDNNFVSPDFGSATYTLRDNAGAAVGGQTNIAIVTAVGQNTINLPIALTYNSKTLDTEIRTVVLNFLVGGRSYQQTAHYLITDWLPYAVTPDDVRSYIGASRAELGDNDMDIVGAYFELTNQVGKAIFDAALAAGGRRAIIVNKAVIYRTAVDCIPGLRLRVNMTEKADAASFERFKTIDWDEFLEDTNTLLAQALAVAGTVIETSRVFITTNLPVDPVTGA